MRSILCCFFIIFFLLYIAYAQVNIILTPNVVNNSQSTTLIFNISVDEQNISLTFLTLLFPEIFEVGTVSLSSNKGTCTFRSSLVVDCSDFYVNFSDSLTLRIEGRIKAREANFYNFLFELNVLNHTSSNISVLRIAVPIEIKDVTPPLIYIVFPSNYTNFTYSPNKEYIFSVSVEDDIKVDCINFYIADRLVGIKCINASSAIVNFTVSDLSVGEYTFYFRANDTSGNQGSSILYRFWVEKAPNPINVFFGKVSNIQNDSVTIEKDTTLQITVLSKGEICVLLNNTLLSFPCREDYVNLTYTFDRIGLFYLFINSSGNWNYTSNSSGIYYWIRVIYPPVKYQILEVPSIEEYAPQKSYNFSFKLTSPSYPLNNISSITFLFNGEIFSHPIINPQTQEVTFSVRDLSAREYHWVLCAVDTQNEKVCVSGNLTVKKATPPLDILNAGTYTIPANVTVIATGCPPQLVCNLYLNNSKLRDFRYDIITEKPLYYVFTYNTTGNENYTSYSIVKEVIILEKIQNITQPENITQNISIEPPPQGPPESSESEEIEEERSKEIYNLSSVFRNIIYVREESLQNLKEVEIDVRKDQQNVYITFKPPSKLPSQKLPGRAILFFEIVTNISQDVIRNVKIRFKVDKEVIIKNNLDVSSISLYRWEESYWRKYETKVINEDAKSIYFEASGDHLSLYAVVGREKKSTSKNLSIIIFIIFIGLAGLLFFVFMMLKGRKDEFEELKIKWKNKLRRA